MKYKNVTRKSFISEFSKLVFKHIVNCDSWSIDQNSSLISSWNTNLKPQTMKKKVKSKASDHWDVVFQNCSDDPKTGLTQPSAGSYTWVRAF